MAALLTKIKLIFCYYPLHHFLPVTIKHIHPQRLTISKYVLTRHANTGVLPNAIQTCAIILARTWSAFVDILFTSRSSITPDTVTGEGAVRVHTLTTMLTRVGPWWSKVKRHFKDNTRAEEQGRKTLTFRILSHRCCIHLCQCCKCFLRIQVDSYSWTSRWRGWCHSVSPLYRGYWYKHHLCGTTNLRKTPWWIRKMVLS